MTSQSNTWEGNSVTHAGQTAREQPRQYPAPGQPRPAIFLSPHYDDAVLSCGGTIAGLVRAGHPPLILTIFGGEAPEELVGPFAGWKHSRWGATTAEEILAIRRAEDLAAAAVLGCRTRWLGHLDAIYRGERYTSDPELFGRLREIEAGLVGIIADEVRSVPEWREDTVVYVPLGIGKHVDHQLTYAVGRRLAGCGVPVFAYEDCPYAIRVPASTDQQLTDMAGDVGAQALVPIGATLGQRLEAIAAYRTQVPVIFRFTEDYAAAVTDHTARVGGTLGPAERYWPLVNDPAQW